MESTKTKDEIVQELLVVVAKQREDISKAESLMQMNQISISNMKSQLANREARLDELISKEVIEAMELEQLKKEILE